MTDHAILIHATGGPEVLVHEAVAVPPPTNGQATIRHEAIGVNFIDTYHRTGLYPLPHLPHGIGMEGAGVVEAVAPDVTVVKPGDRVAYANGPPGSYATRRNLVADRLVPLPDDIDARTAAGVLLQGMTVEYLVRRAFPVEAGMTVLFHAAAGGVGLLACQWLKHLGATVIGTVSSDAKADIARAAGCDHPLVYTREDVVARVRELTGGEGVPVVYDSVGKDTFERSLDCLSRRGTLVGFGNASGKPDPFDALELARRGSLYLTRPTLFDYVHTRAELLQSADALWDVIRAGAVMPHIGRTWPLAEAAAGHRALEARETTGSCLLLPPD